MQADLITQHLIRLLIFIWLIIAVLIGTAVGVGYLLPGGEEMTYTKSFEGGRSQIVTIYLRDIRRNIEARLTDLNSINAIPKWSPDGQHIAYLSLTDGVFQPYIMDALGRNKRHITFQFTTIDSSYVWSPDSQWILFSATVEGVQKSVIINSVTGQTHFLPQAIQSASTKWSLDSKTIIYEGGGEDGLSHLYGMNIDCFEQSLPCTFRKLDLFNDQTPFTQSTRSPDGKSIAFVRNVNGDWKLVVARLGCTDLIEDCVERYDVVAENGLQVAPLWSADSQSLAFLKDASQIDIADLGNGEIRSFPFTNTVLGLANWSPDGHYITYFYTTSPMPFEDAHLYLLDTTNGESRPLFPNPMNASSPEWRPMRH